MSYEHESEREPARDYGVTVDGETSWYFDDAQCALSIVHRDGVWTAAIENVLRDAEEG